MNGYNLKNDDQIEEKRDDTNTNEHLNEQVEIELPTPW